MCNKVPVCILSRTYTFVNELCYFYEEMILGQSMGQPFQNMIQSYDGERDDPFAESSG